MTDDVVPTTPTLTPRPDGAIRLATFNVRHGSTLGSTHEEGVDLERFARAVGQLDADVLALQEVERDSPRSSSADLVAVAAEAMGAQAWHFAPTLYGTTGHYRRAGRRGRGARRRAGAPAYGIGIVSRLPVDRWLRLELDRVPWRARVQGRVPDEPRAALVAAVRTPAGHLTVVTTHTTPHEEVAAGQLDSLVASCAALPRPLVLLGDLNLRAPAPADLSGYTVLADALTHPVDRPVRQIDHVLVDPGAGVVVEPVGPAVAVDTGLSDHRALVVDVRCDYREV